MKTQILYTSEAFTAQFALCCHRFNNLQIAVAWAGDPSKIFPYEHLNCFHGKIDVILGTSFNHTHPDAIRWFMHKINTRVRMFVDDTILFHPKVYLFTSKNRYALFVGSSNMTYGGFYSNAEVNLYIEGSFSSGEYSQIIGLQNKIEEWHSDQVSIVPSSTWLNRYEKQYRKVIRKARKNTIVTEALVDEDIADSSWLRNADWQYYYKKVLNNIPRDPEHYNGIKVALGAVPRLLPIPWEQNYFDDIERRRLIEGFKQYASLGHVGASGKVRRFFAKGTPRQRKKIVKCINHISSMSHPIRWNRLESDLNELVQLGPTMKVWGRILCLMRPDLFCTVAAALVRANLSEVLEMPQVKIATVKGYVKLLQLVHSSPWFNSQEPTDKKEADLWRYRVALLDVIFYEE